MFDNVLADIESVFGGATWKTNSITTIPANYDGVIGDNVREYVMINVLPSRSDNYAYDAKKELKGLIAVKIFTAAGMGQGRLMAISDILDTLLDNKHLSNGTKLGTSYLEVEGLDPSNKSLYMASYFIPFTYYGD